MVSLPTIAQHLIALSLLCVGSFQLLHLHWGTTGSAEASIASLALLLIVALGRLKLRERILLVLAVTASVAALLLHKDPIVLFRQAGLQAAFLTAFMVLLSLLRDAAVTSPSVLALGKFLTSRSPGRRYFAIHVGGQLLGMVLNFGALTLLGPLIQRGARSIESSNKKLADWRERRQLSALMRGFSWTVAWSPATVAMVITVSVVKSASLLVVCACGIGAATGSLVIGWLIDRRTGQQARKSLGLTQSQALTPEIDIKFPVAASKRLATVCTALFSIALLMSFIRDVQIVPALMFASPIVTLIWLVVQHKGTPSFVRELFLKIREIVTVSIPAGLPEAITLAAAGYLGVVVVALVNPVWFADTTGVTNIEAPWLYILVMGLVPLLSNVALPPILTVTVIGGLYSTLPFENIQASLLACALGWGWALNLTASPFGGVPLILSRITGIESTTLSWRWNGVFSMLLFIWCSVWLGILTVIL